MKIRNGFVSNSSSSSFTISKRVLSEEQIDKIENHIEYAIENFPQLKYVDTSDSWAIETTEEVVYMCTFMDNFDMLEFLLLIGIEEDDIKYEFY
jgi:hypothetical protein